MNILEANDIVKRYANHVALNKVSISIKENTIFGLLGPNGAGKTSFIRIINQITAPDEGTIFFNGEPLNKTHISQIGYLPEERGLYKKMKVGEQALYLAQLKGLSRHEALKRLKIWFEKFEIQTWWNRKVEELSKGMQQKVQFIVTIIHEPKFLIFDEPFSGFDPINVNLLKDEILQLKENGSTIIFSTHNMSSVEELCDDIALINKSEKILEGKVRDIKKTYRDNLFNIEIDTPNFDIQTVMPNDFKILNTEIIEEHTKIKVSLPKNTNSKDLLSVILPKCNIHAFNEILPTMNEIFISSVNNQKNNNLSKSISHE